VLFWFAVPTAIYESRKRWTTFFIFIAAWMGTAIVLTICGTLLLVIPGNAEGFSPEQAELLGGIIAQFAMLVGIVICAWHSNQTRKGTLPDNGIILISV
jgi:hypothetical protein